MNNSWDLLFATCAFPFLYFWIRHCTHTHTHIHTHTHMHVCSHTHTRMHTYAHTHMHTHTYTHTHTHTHAHTHTRTHTQTDTLSIHPDHWINKINIKFNTIIVRASKFEQYTNNHLMTITVFAVWLHADSTLYEQSSIHTYNVTKKYMAIII